MIKSKYNTKKMLIEAICLQIIHSCVCPETAIAALDRLAGLRCMTPKRALSSPPAITGLLDSVSFFPPAFAPSIAVLFVSPSEQCQTLSLYQEPPLHIHNPVQSLSVLDSPYKFRGKVREIVRLLHSPVIRQLQLVKLSGNV